MISKMDYDNMNNTVFAVLKPVCDQLILDVNENSTNSLLKLLVALPPTAVQTFQSYICFPINIQLLKTSNSEKKRMLVDCLKELVRCSRIESASLLLRLQLLLYKQIITAADKKSGIYEVTEPCPSAEPEELKLSVVQCLSQLWEAATAQVLHDLYSQENPGLSPLVIMLLQLARSEKLISLRVAALECLQLLCCVSGSRYPDLDEPARRVVLRMLPGIMTCCVSIAFEPITQNHKITVANIQLWSRLVRLVMMDNVPAQKPDSSQLYQLRTDAWLQDCGERLTTATEALLRAQSHAHWLVRQQLAVGVRALLNSCSRNMSPSVGSLVCCLLVLSEDELAEVRAEAAAGLTELSITFSRDTGQPTLQLVEAAFYSLLTRAPRIMQGNDDSAQLCCLSLLVGYLRLQGSHLRQVLCAGSLLHRLLLTLAHVATLDVSHISLLEECSIREVESDTPVTEPWKRLLYCDSPLKVRRLRDACGILWEHADVHTLTHALLDLLDTSPHHSKEVILLINYILGGGEAGYMSGYAELIRSVVNVYLEPRLWSVEMKVSCDSATTTIPQAQSNVVQVSLLAEGLGLFALAMGAGQFSPCLLRCLYPLLECAGSPLYPLASAGSSSVNNVALACVGGGVAELVRTNVDYLSHHVSLRLRHAHHTAGVLGVLAVVIRHTTLDVLPCLQEIIQDVLEQSCDEFQEHNSGNFLRVFLTFLECLLSWQPPEQDPAAPAASRLSLLEQLVEYQLCLETAENLGDEPEGGEEMDETTVPENVEEHLEQEQENKPKPVPPNIQLTVAVLERSLHFLPCKDEQRQILVLDVLRTGVLVLRREEDHLLPVVHKLWAPLVARLQGSLTGPLVMHRAFQLLCTLGHTARDFIRNRTLKQVLPSLCEVLRDSADHSLLKDAGSGYRLTQLYKLQRALLRGLGQLVKDLALQHRDVCQVLQAAAPYLSDRQPTPLQELCRKLYLQVSTAHQELAWLQLMSLWSPHQQLTPPSSHFRVIKLDSCCDESSEFKKNVSQLLKSIDNYLS